MVGALAVENVSAVLANYIVGAKISDLPADVQHQAKRTFLNFIGCAVGGARDDSVNATARALARFSGPASATVLGRGERYDPLLAALLNGMSSAVNSFDDTHAQAVVHAGGPVASALLAYSETQTVSGADFILAYALGVEVVCRTSKAISVPPASAGLNWIQTGICAGVGAAAAVGKLMNLGAPQLVWAIGVAAAQAGGIRGLSRSMCFSLMAGQAAQSGLKAALMAQQSFTSVSDPLGAKYGFAESYSNAANLSALTDGLGTSFEILSNTFKPYPCGVVIHPAIEACLDTIRDRALAPDEVDHVEIEVNPTSATLADLVHPRDPSEAQMSLQHWVAAAIHDRQAGVRQSRPDKLADSSISSLRSKIRIKRNDAVHRESAKITIRRRDGDALRGAVENCRGSQSRPMSDQEIEDKFRIQCAHRLASDDIDAIARAVWSLADVTDCARIAALALGTSQSGEFRDVDQS
jgi:2-methylcitrate dehydratase PrpD